MTITVDITVKMDKALCTLIEVPIFIGSPHQHCRPLDGLNQETGNPQKRATCPGISSDDIEYQ